MDISLKTFCRKVKIGCANKSKYVHPFLDSYNVTESVWPNSFL